MRYKIEIAITVFLAALIFAVQAWLFYAIAMLALNRRGAWLYFLAVCVTAGLDCFGWAVLTAAARADEQAEALYQAIRREETNREN